ncbi:MAG: hypothetical protein V4513_08345 [Pseudomonadota bacterium]
MEDWEQFFVEKSRRRRDKVRRRELADNRRLMIVAGVALIVLTALVYLLI